MDKKIVYSYNRISCSNENAVTTDTSNINASHRHNTE